MDRLRAAFEAITHEPVSELQEIKGSGSNRKYFRLRSRHHAMIGVIGESVAENKAFVALANHFRKQGIRVPEVYYVSDDFGYYLQEDLGDTSLFDAIKRGRSSGSFSEAEVRLLEKAVRALPHLQFKGAEGLDFSVCFPQESFDRRSVMWDLNYFKYSFLKPSGTDFSENKLEDDFERMAKRLTRDTPQTFLFRDFQSRNVMLVQNQPYFIDFQGGRRGPVHYDVASFLWQAKAGFPPALREHLIGVYLEEVQQYACVDALPFREDLRHFVLFRTLQVLGAYGYRGYFERKPHFIESIPYALQNLRKLLKEGFPDYPYLMEVLAKLTQKEAAASPAMKSDLVVRVTSFSFLKGIPDDDSGNGGGYVFDCRGIHNPGRYEPYKQLTGLDKPVIDFLEEDGEIVPFLQHIYALTDKHIERYIERGFAHLMVSFGCTGGQHRSVYSAQHLAEHIHKKHNVKVILQHREQNIHTTLEAL